MDGIPVIRLCQGVGEEGKSHCVMAATSLVAGESFSDTPVCVSQTITSALIRLNDSYGDDNLGRERDLSHLPWLIIGTRGALEHEMKRAFMFADFAVRKIAGVNCDPIVDEKSALAAAAAADAAADAYAAAAAAAAADAAAARAASAYAAALAAAAADAAAAARAASADAAHAASAYAAAAAADAAAAAAAADAWRQKLVAYIESDIIPVYSTMSVEPGCNADKLVLR